MKKKGTEDQDRFYHFAGLPRCQTHTVSPLSGSQLDIRSETFYIERCFAVMSIR